jgi:hypothetical protein
MSMQEIEQLKKALYSQIENLNNETALLMLQEAVTSYSHPAKDILDELTPDQKTRLGQSIEQANNGQTISNDEAEQKVKGWLSR